MKIRIEADSHGCLMLRPYDVRVYINDIEDISLTGIEFKADMNDEWCKLILKYGVIDECSCNKSISWKERIKSILLTRWQKAVEMGWA